MQNFYLIESQEIQQLNSKIDRVEKKIDSMCRNGIGGKDLFTIMEACELLQVSKRTLQKYRDEGMIGFAQVGDKIYFRQTDIDAFLEGNRVEAFKRKGGRA